MTQQTTTQQEQARSPLETLRGIYRIWTGKEPDPSWGGKALRAEIGKLPAYAERFSRLKDEAVVLDDMSTRVEKDIEVAAWLITPHHVRSFKGKVEAEGPLFQLEGGAQHHVKMGKGLDPAPPVMSEFVFPKAMRVLTADGDISYSVQSQPVPRKHGKTAPPTSLTKSLADCWKVNVKRGGVVGKPFDQVFSILTVTEDESAITIFPPGQYSDEYSLKFPAYDAEGNYVETVPDPESVAQQVGLSLESPPKVWKDRLRGRRFTAMGELNVFMERGDSFFGGDGALSALVAQHSQRVKPLGGKKEGQFLDLSDLISPQNPHPALELNGKYIYRLESYPAGDGQFKWRASVRRDQEVAKNGRPLLPEYNCKVKRGVSKAGNDYAMNEGAFVLFGGADGTLKASTRAQALLAVE